MKNQFCAVLGIITLLVIISEKALPQTTPKGPYFGQPPPGRSPRVFAPGFISLENRYEYLLAFSSDLRACVFGVTNSKWNFFTLKYTKMEDDGSWPEPTIAPFLGAGDGLAPAYTQKGNKVFFVSSRPGWPPANIWYSERDDTSWNVPVKMSSPVNSTSNEFGPSLSNDETLYFASLRDSGYGQGDIYYSRLENGQYSSITNIGAPINGPNNEASPFIAPDGSYLLFESDRPGGHGQVDIYISFFKGNRWTNPHNLGAEINTKQIEDGPFVSPDGKYLFFNRRAGFATKQQTDIFWVNANVIFDTSLTRTGGIAPSPDEHRLGKNFSNPIISTTTVNDYLKNER